MDFYILLAAFFHSAKSFPLISRPVKPKSHCKMITSPCGKTVQPSGQLPNTEAIFQMISSLWSWKRSDSEIYPFEEVVSWSLIQKRKSKSIRKFLIDFIFIQVRKSGLSVFMSLNFSVNPNLHVSWFYQAFQTIILAKTQSRCFFFLSWKPCLEHEPELLPTLR